MGYQTKYAGTIWTTHAQERLQSRGVPQSMAYDAFKSPDRVIPGKHAGSKQYEKKVGISTITLIARQNERREWVIISGWIDPPLPGTKDFRKRQEWKQYKKAGFWGQLWYLIKNTIS